MFENSSIKRAVKANDIPALRKFLAQHPEYLEEQLSWRSQGDGFRGPLLAMAASFNKPDVVEFLIKEKKVSADQRENHPDLWVALHFAYKVNAYDAAAKLLDLGANPMLRASNGKLPKDFTRSMPMIELISSALVKRQAQKPAETPVAERTSVAAKKPRKIALAEPVDRWTRPSAAEVMHERLLPDTSLRLTDIFNFENRYWQAIVRDGATMTQKIVFFDEMPDKAAARQAHARYKGLGGMIPQDVVDSGLVKSKPPQRQ